MFAEIRTGILILGTKMPEVMVAAICSIGIFKTSFMF